MELLREEKAQLEKQLETETDDSEMDRIKDRIEEIAGYFKQPVTNVTEPSPEADTLRRSERERRPTQKMQALKDNDIQKRERKFWSTYNNFKTEVQFVRSKLKYECSKTNLEGFVLSVQECESDLKRDYESLRAVTTPAQDIRRKMDTCLRS